jgi:hypothetical protein
LILDEEQRQRSATTNVVYQEVFANV